MISFCLFVLVEKKTMLTLRFAEGRNESQNSACGIQGDKIVVLSSSSHLAFFTFPFENRIVVRCDANLQHLRCNEQMVLTSDDQGCLYAFDWSGLRLWQHIVHDRVQELSPIVNCHTGTFVAVSTLHRVDFFSLSHQKVVAHVPVDSKVCLDTGEQGAVIGDGTTLFCITSRGSISTSITPVAVTAVCLLNGGICLVGFVNGFIELGGDEGSRLQWHAHEGSVCTLTSVSCDEYVSYGSDKKLMFWRSCHLVASIVEDDVLFLRGDNGIVTCLLTDRAKIFGANGTLLRSFRWSSGFQPKSCDFSRDFFCVSSVGGVCKVWLLSGTSTLRPRNAFVSRKTSQFDGHHCCSEQDESVDNLVTIEYFSMTF